MGAAFFHERLITSDHMAKTYKACSVDSDCYGANGNYFAASKNTESLRCCMRIEIRKKGQSLDAEVARNMLEITHGWPKEYYEYVKVCKYDYAIYFENLQNDGVRYQNSENEVFYKGNAWTQFCDGGATMLYLGAGIGSIVTALY